MDEIKITDIAAKKISRRIFNSIFVVDKVWKIKHGDPIWVSKKPNVFSWISILNLDTAKPKNINKKTGPVIDIISWYIIKSWYAF